MPMNDFEKLAILQQWKAFICPYRVDTAKKLRNSLAIP
jgi:hypothetical protein